MGSTSEIGFTDNLLTLGPSQEGGFVPLAGSSGTIDNILDPPSAPGTALAVADFVTLTAAPNISFELTLVAEGIDGAAGCAASPAAPGQVCTPLLPSLNPSPFNFQNSSGSSSTLSFKIAGLEDDSLTDNTVPFTGIFTSQFGNENFQQLLSVLAGGGTVTTTFSATFTTEQASPVPEPSTLIWMLIIVGMMGLVRLTRRTESQS